MVIRRRGFSLIEFVIASTLTVAVVVMASSAIGSAQNAVTRNRNKDQAVLVATDALSKANVLQCGMELVSATDPSVNATSATISSRCRSRFGVASVAGGDFTAVDRRLGRNYSVRMETVWRQQSAAATECVRSDNAVPAGERWQPTVLVTTMTVSWSEFKKNTRTVTMQSTRSIPSSWRDLTRGSLHVATPYTKPTLIRLSTSPIAGAGSSVVRYTDSRGCAWFPYLTPGAYYWSVGYGTAVKVIVGSGAPTKVAP